MPILEPPLLGFTKTGNLSLPANSSGFLKLFFIKRTDLATGMSYAAATAVVYLLLKVIADVAALQDV
jgi:hypothetical protein